MASIFRCIESQNLRQVSSLNWYLPLNIKQENLVVYVQIMWFLTIYVFLIMIRVYVIQIQIIVYFLWITMSRPLRKENWIVCSGWHLKKTNKQRSKFLHLMEMAFLYFLFARVTVRERLDNWTLSEFWMFNYIKGIRRSKLNKKTERSVERCKMCVVNFLYGC